MMEVQDFTLAILAVQMPWEEKKTWIFCVEKKNEDKKLVIFVFVIVQN